MKKETGRLTRAFVFAVIVHVVFLSFLIVSFEWTPKTPTAGAPAHVVKAVAVDEKKVQAEMRKLQQAKDRAKARKDEELKRVQQRLAQEKQRLKQVEEQRHAADAKRKADLQAEKDKEAKRLADLKQKQQDEANRQQKLKEQQAAAEKQRQEEEQQRQAEEKKRQEEAKRQAALKAQQEKERQQKAEEERQRKEAEQALQQQLAEEKAQRDQGVVDQYIGLIKQKVTRNWVRPAGWQTGQTCEVHIQLIPDGEVVNVQVANSCGSPLSDQSVETAVTRASPLPLPPDPTLFDRFRDIKFIFNPKE